MANISDSRMMALPNCSTFVCSPGVRKPDAMGFLTDKIHRAFGIEVDPPASGVDPISPVGIAIVLLSFLARSFKLLVGARGVCTVNLGANHNRAVAGGGYAAARPDCRVLVHVDRTDR